jgi:hypothetical protein
MIVGKMPRRCVASVAQEAKIKDITKRFGHHVE